MRYSFPSHVHKVGGRIKNTIVKLRNFYREGNESPNLSQQQTKRGCNSIDKHTLDMLLVDLPTLRYRKLTKPM